MLACAGSKRLDAGRLGLPVPHAHRHWLACPQPIQLTALPLAPPPVLPRRLYANASMSGKLLVADSCETSGDTVLTVLASPFASGDSWTACYSNDGERPGGWAGGWAALCNMIGESSAAAICLALPQCVLLR